MHEIHIQYFAQLREERGCASETLKTKASTPALLFAELHEMYGFSLGQDIFKAAVNDEFASWDKPLEDGDTVVFIQPVAGG